MRPINAAALCCLLLAGCGASEAPVAVETPSIEVEVTPVAFNTDGAPTVVFQAPAMHCEVCSASVCEAIKGKPGVVDVKADAETKLVTVAVEEAAFESETVIDAIAEANFGEATPVSMAEAAAILAERNAG